MENQSITVDKIDQPLLSSTMTEQNTGITEEELIVKLSSFIQSTDLINFEKACEYKGIDMPKIRAKIFASMNADDYLKLSLLFFKRGFNLNKVFTKWTGPGSTELETIARRVIERVSPLQPDTVNTSRFCQAFPLAHPLFLKSGVSPQHKMLISPIPRACHTNNIFSCLPQTPDYSGLVYAAIIYQIYIDTVINAAIGQRKANFRTVEEIEKYAITQWDSDVPMRQQYAELLQMNDMHVLFTHCKELVIRQRGKESAVAWPQLSYELKSMRPQFPLERGETCVVGAKPFTALSIVPRSLDVTQEGDETGTEMSEPAEASGVDASFQDPRT